MRYEVNQLRVKSYLVIRIILVTVWRAWVVHNVKYINNAWTKNKKEVCLITLNGGYDLFPKPLVSASHATHTQMITRHALLSVMSR